MTHTPDDATARRETDPAAPAEAPSPDVQAALAEAARRSGFGRVEPGERPTPQALWGAVGGVRGLIESLLPGFLFLVVFTITQEVAPSVLVPLAIAVVFVLVRALTRTPVAPAIIGLVGIALSAGLALFTGRAEENFVLGFVINSVWLAALLMSLIVRRPLLGVITSLLTGDKEWRSDPAKRSVLTLTTWLWVGLFTLRLGVQLPFYLAENVTALAASRLIMGLPLYAAVLWVTWLMIRAVYARSRA
ncbi:uncharacterized protein DUF3159 [Microcella putealis]|uniref:Uncharacterized protein DUF3159 n=1 Tax=Microcella putealis TaxID=337005 RepID=A0A4Q7LKZ2_9MICO|nr:DUF3159 domain-containing protein [Microcella putealis]RZS54288.1 uncharacterized protein DUF3159 [Microcella putealis]TQM24958.1 uncharacterized protein DUF3159 [Microcella putealis]